MVYHEFYDTKIQDQPITNNNEFAVRPRHGLDRYPTLDDNDPDASFIKSINLD